MPTGIKQFSGNSESKQHKAYVYEVLLYCVLQP